MDIIEDIEENVREGEEDIEKLVEKAGIKSKKIAGGSAKKIEKGVGKELKKDVGKIEKLVGKDAKKTRDFAINLKKEVEKEIENAGKLIKDTARKIEKGFKRKAEAESTTSEDEIEKKRKAILEKAKKLEKKIAAEGITSEELKEKVRAKKRADMLVPLEEYVKAGIYLGTRVVTPDMKPFVYRRRADGLAIFNTDLIDEKLKEGAQFLAKFSPEDVILVCKRQAGWKVAEKFGKITGIRTFTKKYPAGILTNKQLPDFFENELTVITDQWVDKNALADTLKVRKKVLMICDTNNFSHGANQIIIGNNKSERSLGLIFYILTREYCKARGIDAGKNIPDLEWWTGEMEEQQRQQKAKEIRAEPRAEFGV